MNNVPKNAKKLTDGQIERLMLVKARTEGRFHGKRNNNIECPYQEGTDMYFQWVKGFAEGKLEHGNY